MEKIQVFGGPHDSAVAYIPKRRIIEGHIVKVGNTFYIVHWFEEFKAFRLHYTSELESHGRRPETPSV